MTIERIQVSYVCGKCGYPINGIMCSNNCEDDVRDVLERMKVVKVTSKVVEEEISRETIQHGAIPQNSNQVMDL